MANHTININTRFDGSNKFFVFDHPETHATVEILYTRVPSALGMMGIQMPHEFDLAIAKLAGLSLEYEFSLSADAIALREEVFEISGAIFGDEVSEKAWNAALKG